MRVWRVLPWQQVHLSHNRYTYLTTGIYTYLTTGTLISQQVRTLISQQVHLSHNRYTYLTTGTYTYLTTGTLNSQKDTCCVAIPACRCQFSVPVALALPMRWQLRHAGLTASQRQWLRAQSEPWPDEIKHVTDPCPDTWNTNRPPLKTDLGMQTRAEQDGVAGESRIELWLQQRGRTGSWWGGEGGGNVGGGGGRGVKGTSIL